MVHEHGCLHGPRRTGSRLKFQRQSRQYCGCTIRPHGHRGLNLSHHSSTNKAMFRKRRPTNTGASDGSNSNQSRCEWIWYHPCNQLTDGSAAPSKEAKDRRWREDPPRHFERVLGLVSSPQIRPRWRERAHQTLRGTFISRRTPPQLTRKLAGIRRCQGEDRGSYSPVGEAQAKRHCDND